jgi:hypothetical protein
MDLPLTPFSVMIRHGSNSIKREQSSLIYSSSTSRIRAQDDPGFGDVSVNFWVRGVLDEYASQHLGLFDCLSNASIALSIDRRRGLGGVGLGDGGHGFGRGYRQRVSHRCG